MNRTNAIIKAKTTVKIILIKPILKISPMASLIAKASLKLSFLANLHLAINSANAKMMNKTMPINETIHLAKKIDKIIKTTNGTNR